MFSVIRLTARERSLLVLLAIIAVAAALRVVLFKGYVGLDDAEYAQLAHQLAQGSYQPGTYAGPAVFPLRVGVIVPTAVLFRVAGVSEWTMVLYPFVLSLAGVALIYLCCSSLFGRRAGLIAAALLAIFPWEFESATKLLPDLPAAFYAALGVTVIILLEQKDRKTAPLMFVGGVAAGLAFGASWLCKETVAYLAPFCAAVMVITVRRHGRATLFMWAGVAAGSLAVLAGETAVYYRYTGDALFRLHEVERNYWQNQKYFFVEGSSLGWQKGTSYAAALLRRWFATGPSVILFNRTFLYLPLMALGLTVVSAWRRDRAFLIPAIWLWVLVLMFDFGSSSLRSYRPLPLFDRYLYLIFFPAIVIVAGFLARTVFAPGVLRARRVSPAQWVGLATAATALWFGATELRLDLKYRQAWMEEVRAMRTSVQPQTVTFADTFTLRAFEFFEGYPAKTAWTDFEQLGSSNQMPPGAIVIINNRYLEWLDKHGGIWGSRTSGYPAPAFHSSPPASWTRIWHNGTVSVYRVGTRTS